jgi:glycosyltransferase involved in cell wall biosynthesis
MSLTCASQDCSPEIDIVCLSHLRWNWVFQRPQHLLTRAARSRRVFFVEEPVMEPDALPRLVLSHPHKNVTVGTPHIASGLEGQRLQRILGDMLDRMLASHAVDSYLLWYYTPMALPFSRHLQPTAVVYDCMDQLSAFAGAPPELLDLEQELLSRCDVVFTGGLSLFDAKQRLHNRVYCYPSSVDVDHFSAARTWSVDPLDQSAVRRPRLGYYGVIDERLDLGLIASLAHARPDWELVLVGPIAKIEQERLPRAANIHYLGAKNYADLPAYVAGWDVALMPFARNEATKYISPTKTPEYLAAGKPVVSTSIRDVIRTYGEARLVRIADEVDEMVSAVEESLLENPVERLRRADGLLQQLSWDKTWDGMQTVLTGLPVFRFTAEAA